MKFLRGSLKDARPTIPGDQLAEGRRVLGKGLLWSAVSRVME
jgi:hypothetical protein